MPINQQHVDMGSVVLELYLRKAGLIKGRIIIMERGGMFKRLWALKNDRRHVER